MAQADQTVQNDTFPTVRADINNNLAALFTNSSGNAAPTVTVAFQDWIDTAGSDPIWKKRNAANNAWITVATIIGNTINVGSFVSGTVMLFQQTAAPTGSTKLTTHNDKALRVVSGSVGSGGATAFSATLNGSVGATTLTESQMPSHVHQQIVLTATSVTGARNVQWQNWTAGAVLVNNTAATGGGGSHTHSINVQYVDVIFATKD